MLTAGGWAFKHQKNISYAIWGLRRLSTQPHQYIPTTAIKSLLIAILGESLWFFSVPWTPCFEGAKVTTDLVSIVESWLIFWHRWKMSLTRAALQPKSCYRVAVYRFSPHTEGTGCILNPSRRLFYSKGLSDRVFWPALGTQRWSSQGGWGQAP